MSSKLEAGRSALETLEKNGSGQKARQGGLHMMESGIFYYREIGNAIREKDEQVDRFEASRSFTRTRR